MGNILLNANHFSFKHDSPVRSVFYRYRRHNVFISMYIKYTNVEQTPEAFYLTKQIDPFAGIEIISFF